MAKLTIHLVGDRPLVQRQHEQVGSLPRQGALDRHRARRQARAFEQNVVLGDRAAVAPHRFDQAEERTARDDEVAERRAVQRRRADPEELLGRGIDEADRAVPVQRNHRMRERGQHKGRIGADPLPRRRGRRHAASRSMSGS